LFSSLHFLLKNLHCLTRQPGAVARPFTLSGEKQKRRTGFILHDVRVNAMSIYLKHHYGKIRNASRAPFTRSLRLSYNNDTRCGLLTVVQVRYHLCRAVGVGAPAACRVFCFSTGKL
jgi:hypothetical protein